MSIWTSWASSFRRASILIRSFIIKTLSLQALNAGPFELHLLLNISIPQSFRFSIVSLIVLYTRNDRTGKLTREYDNISTRHEDRRLKNSACDLVLVREKVELFSVPEYERRVK